jgi:hypothetical protein
MDMDSKSFNMGVIHGILISKRQGGSGVRRVDYMLVISLRTLGTAILGLETKEVAERLGHENPDNKMIRDIGQVLRELGYVKKQRKIKDRVCWIWDRP